VYHSNPVGELINPFLPLSRIQADNWWWWQFVHSK
jgi:hypothetical protein